MTALGEERGYQSSDPDRQAVIEFVECEDGLESQAAFAVAEIIPAAISAKPGRSLGDIAILYRDYRAGDIVAEAVAAAELEFVRVDTAAPYRKVVLTSWIEDCAAWCSGGWREGRRVSVLLCMTDLAHASKLKEHDDNDDFQGTTGRAA